MDISRLVNITCRAWTLPILASLHNGVPGRQAPLLAATGAGRSSFALSMDHLIEIGLLERNPGYGHPLRPEFRLTEEGIRAAALAHDVKGNGGRLVLRKAWTVPVLATLQEPRPFGGIKAGLGSITDRALSQSLKSLEGEGWVERRIDPALRPVRPIYGAINAGHEIAQSIAPHLSA